MNLKYTADQVSDAISEKRREILQEYLSSEAFKNDLAQVEPELELAMSAGNKYIQIKKISKPELMADFLRQKGFCCNPWVEGSVQILFL